MQEPGQFPERGSPEGGQAKKGDCVAIIGVNEQVETFLHPLPLPPLTPLG